MIKRALVLLFVLFMAAKVIIPVCHAADKEEKVDPEVAKIAELAARTITDFEKPYRIVALGVTPAVLPDEVDYLLHEPAGVDISFPLDTFKRHYCESKPAGTKLEIIETNAVKITEWNRTFRRSGVYLDYPKLVESVKGTVEDFRESEGENRYDYSVTVTRSASARVRVRHLDAEGKPRQPTACNPDGESTIFVSFLEHEGRWRLYDISRREEIACKTGLGFLDPPGMVPTPLYSDCGMPENLDARGNNE